MTDNTWMWIPAILAGAAIYFYIEHKKKQEQIGTDAASIYWFKPEL